jgi:hypothetical protein
VKLQPHSTREIDAGSLDVSTCRKTFSISHTKKPSDHAKTRKCNTVNATPTTPSFGSLTRSSPHQTTPVSRAPSPAAAAAEITLRNISCATTTAILLCPPGPHQKGLNLLAESVTERALRRCDTNGKNKGVPLAKSLPDKVPVGMFESLADGHRNFKFPFKSIPSIAVPASETFHTLHPYLTKRLLESQ